MNRKTSREIKTNRESIKEEEKEKNARGKRKNTTKKNIDLIPFFYSSIRANFVALSFGF